MSIPGEDELNQKSLAQQFKSLMEECLHGDVRNSDRAWRDLSEFVTENQQDIQKALDQLTAEEPA